MFSVLILGAIWACTSHEDLPPQLNVVTSPIPSNFTVTTSDDITFTLNWTISDPTTVAYYNLYFNNPVAGFEFVDSTSTTSAQITTQVAFPGAEFGVASVSIGNIESSIAKASAGP